MIQFIGKEKIINSTYQDLLSLLSKKSNSTDAVFLFKLGVSLLLRNVSEAAKESVRDSF